MKIWRAFIFPGSVYIWRLTALLCVLTGALTSRAADFTVTTPGGQFAFNINGTNSPTLTLVRGQTYTFAVSTSAGLHPFRINSTGATPNNITSGTITYTVPAAAANYTYDCGVHGVSMQGSILTVEPTPTAIRITEYSVTSNILLRSTGATTFVPEFQTNLNTVSNWFALTVETNRIVNGTNETICGKPPGDAVFIRLRSP